MHDETAEISRMRTPVDSVSILTGGLQAFVLGCAIACLRRLSESRSLVQKINIIIILMINEANILYQH